MKERAAGTRPGDLWLIRLRWLAIAGVAIATGLAWWQDVVESPVPLLAIAGALAVANVVWLRLSRRTSEPDLGPGFGRFVFLQLAMDLVALSLLIHFAGGVENPFVMFFAFHLAIGGILLPRGLAWGLAGFAGVLHGAIVVQEAIRVLPPHPLRLGPGSAAPSAVASPLGTVGYLAAFWLMLAGVLLFVRAVRERQLRAEARAREQERIALARERLARVGEVYAGVAHTVRNPLHGALSCLEFLERHPDAEDSAREEMFSLLREGLERIEKVTRRILALARGDGFHRTPTDVAALLGEVVRSVEMKARNRGVTVEIDIGSAPDVEIAADRVSEALVAVLDNAIDACSPGGRVRLRASTSAAREALSFDVADDGHGIEPEHLPRLFDPFFTTKAIGEGSGLGLAIAKGVVEEHGGTMEVESVPGTGTRVHISLPVASRTDTSVQSE